MLKFLQIFVCMALFFTPVMAHEHEKSDKEDVSDITIENITEGLDMIQAGGGNIAVLHGDEGVFVIDNGLLERSDDVMNAIAEVADGQEITMLVNTHWHFDHAGNNTKVADSGAIIIAHDNVRKRLQQGGVIKAFDKKIEPAPVSALPILTYDEGVTVHLNGKSASVMKITPAHTDGDSVIFWKDLNIIHTGDIFFNGIFPFIDGSSGGSLRGMITATDKVLSMVDNQTKIIPGHGALAQKSDLVAYNTMLKDVSKRIEKAKKLEKNREDWIASKPLANLTAQWAGGFLNTDKFTEIVWDAY